MKKVIHWIRTSGLRFLSALVLSFALWIYVSYSENPDQSTSFEGVPVYVQNLPENLIIVDQDGMPRTDQSLLSSVSLFVKTDQETLRGLRQRQLRAFVDLSNLPPGENQVKVGIESTTSEVRLSSFSVIKPEPEYLSVRLDERVQQTIPLSIEVQGNLPFSFERGPAEATVDGKPVQHVTISGPRERVERVTRAKAVANIDQLRASYASTLQLTAVDRNGDAVRGVEITPATVSVRVPIRSVVGLKRVPVLGMISGTPADGYIVRRITCTPPLVNITGSSGRLDHIDNIETFPIAIDGASTSLTRSVELNFPAGVLGSTSDDGQVVVTVEIVPLVRPFQIRLPFSVEVRGGNYPIDYRPKVLLLTLQGASTALAQITPTTLVATVEGGDLLPGHYERLPRLTLPEGVQAVGEIPLIELTVFPLSPLFTLTPEVVPLPLTPEVVPSPFLEGQVLTPTTHVTLAPTTTTILPRPPLPTQPTTKTSDVETSPDAEIPSTETPSVEVLEGKPSQPLNPTPDPLPVFPLPGTPANPSPPPTSTLLPNVPDEHDVPVLAPEE